MDNKILYMLFAIEAKLNAQQDLLIELADILTNKNPDQIRSEMALKTIAELKKVKENMDEINYSSNL